MMNYVITYNNLHIYNGFETEKWDMCKELKKIREATKGGTKVFERSLFSLTIEWTAHNFLYVIGYKREQTKDVDLNNPSDRPEWLYIVCGLLTWLWIW